MLPDRVVFTYQGDGDLAAIGTAETIHAANRGENITVIFINNAIYGMTGGQMAPTTMLGQYSTTTPKGRGKNQEGSPIRVCELLSSLDGICYMERVAVSTPKDVMQAKRAIKKAFENQLAGKGYSLVEVLSMCPTDWKLSPEDAIKFVNEDMKKIFPLGIFKDR
jgi:2-oxoglutarate ferredoxin oxidoreductase subunit beta